MRRIEIPQSSATDYSYLVNECNGWMSDDQLWYEFDNDADYEKMKTYLDNWK